MFKCPALPLPLVQIPGPQALPNVKFRPPKKDCCQLPGGCPGGMLKVRIDRCMISYHFLEYARKQQLTSRNIKVQHLRVTVTYLQSYISLARQEREIYRNFLNMKTRSVPLRYLVVKRCAQGRSQS